jgi:hypothetical protein
LAENLLLFPTFFEFGSLFIQLFFFCKFESAITEACCEEEKVLERFTSAFFKEFERRGKEIEVIEFSLFDDSFECINPDDVGVELEGSNEVGLVT